MGPAGALVARQSSICDHGRLFGCAFLLQDAVFVLDAQQWSDLVLDTLTLGDICIGETAEPRTALLPVA